MKCPDDIVIDYTVPGIVSILLNHLYPDHNVRRMLPFCTLRLTMSGYELRVSKFAEVENRPPDAKE